MTGDAAETSKEGDSLAPAQLDGAPVALNGSGMNESALHEPEYDVEVKLSSLQSDPNNPLFSVKTFEELGL